jgi:aldehyde:ferredoxin oxidoreductase
MLIAAYEYKRLRSLGSLLCVNDLAAISKENELCNRYTLDTISTGAASALSARIPSATLFTALFASRQCGPSESATRA